MTFSGALFLLVFGLIRGNAEGWGSALIVALLIGAAVLLVAFVVVERARRAPDARPRRCSASPRSPAPRSPRSSLSASMFAMFLYLTLYIQNILGYSPLEAGLRFLPITLLSFFVAPIAGQAGRARPACAGSSAAGSLLRRRRRCC